MGLNKRKLSEIGVIFAVLAGTLLLIISCGGGENSPREVVIKMFGAMERDDTAALNELLDIPALMEVNTDDYALQVDTPRVFHSPDDLLNDLTGNGQTKRRWFSYQRVLGRSETKGDTAFVEVSFISKATDTQYYNKFGLHRNKSGRWKIYSFRTVSVN